MKNKISIIIVVLICLIMCGCTEKTKVTFYYNCPGTKEYICDVVNKKLDCKFEMPQKCAGKTFVGWYDTNAHGTLVNLDSDFNENTSLYAYWDKTESTPVKEPEKKPQKNSTKESETKEEEAKTKITYKVSFNLNGGNGGLLKTLSVKYKEKMPSINTEKPTRTGYEFMGWYDNSDYETGTKYYDKNCKSVKTFTEKENIILYAGWKEVKTELKKELKKEEIVENAPLMASKTYTVSFNLNGGNGGEPNDIIVTYKNKMPSINVENPTRAGYKFMGWYDNSNYKKGTKYYSLDGTSTKKYKLKRNLTLYAGWKVITYKIDFDLNGGSNGQKGYVNVNYGSELPKIKKSIPSKDGYIFMGWYNNKDYTKGEQYYDEKCNGVKLFEDANNITLYAGWSKVIVVSKYQVGFNINGGSGSVPKSVSVALGDAMPSITQTIPTRTNYIFMGWYDNTDYTKGNKYYTNKNKSARSYDKKEDIVLYAGWKADETNPSISATCSGEYENGYGLAKLSVKVSSGIASNYRFIIDKKTVQDSSNNSYIASSNFTLLINPQVEITASDGRKTTLNCDVKHTSYIKYNKKGYYFSKKAAKDKSKSVENPYSKNNLSYFLYVPPDVSPTEKLPLIIGLHGGYGYGQTCNGVKTTEKTQTNHYLKTALYYRKKPINNDMNADVRAVVITPSNMSCQWYGSIYNAYDILYAYIKLYNIDFDNIIVTGSSQGGYGTLLMGMLDEHIVYISSDDKTTLESVAKEYGTTKQAVIDYNSKLRHNISFSDSKKTKLAKGKGLIIRAKNDDDQRSLFSVLIPMSPAKVVLRCAFTPSTIYDGGGCKTTPPYTIKTPIWVITSNDESGNVEEFGQELAAYYLKNGTIRYTVLTNLKKININPHDTQEAILGRTAAINWMLKQKYGKVNVVNDSELSAIEASLGSNFAGVWEP